MTFKKTFFTTLLLLAFVFPSAINAQTRQADRQKTRLEEKSFFSIQKEFNDYWAPYNVKNGYYTENGIKKKAAGWKQFRRWEWYWDPRVDPVTGKFPTTGAADIRKQMFRPPTSGGRAATGNWTSMGPSTTTGGYAGLGRLNCVAFRAGDNNTFYVGSPSGGFWKTTDAGSNWTALTDANDVLGVSDAIVIAGATPASDIIYIGTGDRDGGSMWALGGGQKNDNNSIGVLKSTDGGTSWATTGLTFTASQKRTVNRMLVNPNDNTMLYAATSVGVYQTTDAGVNWTLLVATEFVDMVFKPGTPATIYGSTRGGIIQKSTDSGATWTNVLDLSGAGVARIDLAVSANQPTWVYAITVNSSKGLYGIYKSTDSGATFSLVYNGSNMLGWYCDGSDTGGQGNYDLCIAADPNNANVVFIGGVDTWKSSDGGSTWAASNMWTGGSPYNTCGTPVVHADKHFMAFQDGTSTLFECNDGGLYKTSDGGTTWSHVGNGLVISQMYRLGVAQTVSNDVITGLQDNGTKAMLSGTWNDVIGGDGMECAIDYTNENTQYGELYNGDLKRTTNHWSTSTTITSGLTGTAWWVMPFVIDPNVNTTLYAGKQDVFKSTNQGTSWTQISSWAGSSLRSLTVAPSNSAYIYAATQTILYRTTDGGTSWSNITGTLPVGTSSITYITVKDTDPNTVWVSMGQYNSDGVYQTTDGGATWTNISTGLPAIPVMCVIQNTQNTAQVELYAGTDVGVYVKVGGTNWALFSTGLPNVVVNELEIYYNSGTPSLSRIRAATSGRGLWESELYSAPNLPPVANFTADAVSPGVGQTVTFTDQSTNVPTSWSWVFTPATVSFVGGTSATSQNPQVQFNATGNYTVQLTATNAYGSDINNKVDYISVSSLLSYCTAGSGTTFEYISNVQLGTINNSSGSSGYADYTGISTDLTINQTYNISVSNGQIDTNDDLGIWIDWNRDGVFSDPAEKIVCEIDGDGQGTFSFTVPTTALLGYTTMRIRIKWSGADCGSPCGTTTYGEVEDYKINVLPGLNTWIGTTTDWNTASNWSDNVVPTGSYNIIIPVAPTGGNFPTVPTGTTARCNDISVSSSADITVNGTIIVGGN